MTESTDPERAALAIPVKIDTLMGLDGRVAVVTGTSSGLASASPGCSMPPAPTPSSQHPCETR